jgi:hypothetical protein
MNLNVGNWEDLTEFCVPPASNEFVVSFLDSVRDISFGTDYSSFDHPFDILEKFDKSVISGAKGLRLRLFAFSRITFSDNIERLAYQLR